MRKRDSNADGHGQRAVTIRWIQVVLFAVVVLLVGFRIWERHNGGGSSSVVFGLMAASALSIGVLERYRATAAKRSR
ncbi:hypothetical protein GCM10022403_099280 [Streptomyces coacervatus]|uniref:DUF2631 domain-containing protein n=1 Tax=Streptomyces coacervatus TaxID=647381 RepID=A0ABP7JS33_9ACTN|nr:hypothetical protein [Streptomyces coacervatus]MDF2263839.1 hypothetical protein [Streptomyces coacervatus]